MVRRWLITGGCGFIGRNLVANLVAEGGHIIRIIDNLSAGTKEGLSQVCTFKEVHSNNLSTFLPTHSSDPVELIVGDIMDDGLALKACEGFDAVVHLAANTGVAPSVDNPRLDCRTNVLGTLNYLEAARHCKAPRFIFASSGAPLGEVEPPIHEELAPHPVSPYGASKLAGEGYCSAYYRTYGVETVCLRFGNVYGPLSGHKNSVVAKFIKQALRGETLEIYGDGNQTRDFVHIDDLIDAIVKSSVKEVAGETFQIATNREHTVNELVALLRMEFDRSLHLPIRIRHGNSRLGDIKRNYSDNTKARDQLAWRPSFSLRTGLKQTIDWFNRHR